MSTAKQYVLGKMQGPGTCIFIAGPNPRAPGFDHDPSLSARFPSPGAALGYRTQMPYQSGGGAEQYGVYELTLDGQLNPVSG